MYNLIACVDLAGGIGKNGTIPWKCPEDLEYFKETTSGHVCIMGRKTWDSLPFKLPGRVNIVISRGHVVPKGDKDPDYTFTSLYHLLLFIEKNRRNTFKGKEFFVIGGAQIYSIFLNAGLVHKVYLNELSESYDCDVKFPRDKLKEFDPCFICSKPIGDNGSFSIFVYTKKNESERKFLNLLGKVLMHGVERPDRTGVGTKAIFSPQLRFDLNDGFPILTSRPLPLRMIFEELMWILRGETDVKILEDKGIKIWTPNSTEEFLKKQNLPYEAGDIGPSYGWQMRKFGKEYNPINRKFEEDLKAGRVVTCTSPELMAKVAKDNFESGKDQLANVIHLLKTNPSSRRILISLWNPLQLKEMALPPCVWSYQFFVSFASSQKQVSSAENVPTGSKTSDVGQQYLSCKIVQRSSDISLAGGWNIASGALLTHMLASVCGMGVGEIIWSPADTHIYMNQLEGVREQIKREPYPFPKLFITRPDTKAEDSSGLLKTLLDFKWDNIDLIGYKTHPRIKLAMNA